MTLDPKERERLESDARVHRIVGWAVFIALLASAFLPARYSLYAFAFPVGMVAIALYYWRFREVANLEAGLTMLLLVVALQAFGIWKNGSDRRQANEQIEDLICRSHWADRADPSMCDEALAILYPEPPVDWE